MKIRGCDVVEGGNVTLHITRTSHTPASRVLGTTTPTRLPCTVAGAIVAPSLNDTCVLEGGPLMKFCPFIVSIWPAAILCGETDAITGPVSGIAISDRDRTGSSTGNSAYPESPRPTPDKTSWAGS